MFTRTFNSIIFSTQTKTGFINFIAHLISEDWQKITIAGKYRHSVNKLAGIVSYLKDYNSTHKNKLNKKHRLISERCCYYEA